MKHVISNVAIVVVIVSSCIQVLVSQITFQSRDMCHRMSHAERVLASTCFVIEHHSGFLCIPCEQIRIKYAAIDCVFKLI